MASPPRLSPSIPTPTVAPLRVLEVVLYVGNLPSNITARWFRTIFSRHCAIVKCFVPAKPNSKGRRFGFVTISDRKEAARVMGVLNGAYLLNNRLHVAWAKQPQIPTSSSISKHGRHLDWSTTPTNSKFDLSAAVKDPKLHPLGPLHGRKSGDSLQCQISPSNLLLNKLRWSVLAVSRDSVSAEHLQQQIASEGFQLTVHSLAPRVFALSFEDQATMSSMQVSNWTWLLHWFTCFYDWNHIKKQGGQFCWLSVKGLPFHSWCSDSIVNISKLFGQLICLHPNMLSGLNMEQAQFLVHTNVLSKISREVEVNLGDSSFIISVEDCAGPDVLPFLLPVSHSLQATPSTLCPDSVSSRAKLTPIVTGLTAAKSPDSNPANLLSGHNKETQASPSHTPSDPPRPKRRHMTTTRARATLASAHSLGSPLSSEATVSGQPLLRRGTARRVGKLHVRSLPSKLPRAKHNIPRPSPAVSGDLSPTASATMLWNFGKELGLRAHGSDLEAIEQIRLIQVNDSKD